MIRSTRSGVVAATLAAAAFAAFPVLPASAAMSMTKPVTVTISPQNGSGESGTATLTAMGARTKVVVHLTGAPASPAQPAHIHIGTCAKLNPTPAYPLTSLTGGSSTTIVNVALGTLEKSAYAINVHLSAAKLTHYVACGDIPKTSPM